MKLVNKALGFSFLAASAVMAQGPMYDKIIVTLPYEVKINETVLQPGEYEIRQDTSPTNNRILRFYTDKGMKFETTAMAIPALDNRTPEQTSLILDKYGSEYYLNKIWVQGKNYGYEFPIPDGVKSREKERTATTVSATYQPSTQTSTRPATEPAPIVETAQNNPPPAVVDAQPAREPEVVTPARPVEMAQNTPPPSPPMAEAHPSQGAADTTAPPMPATSADWLNLILGGGALTGVGLLLRRRVKA